MTVNLEVDGVITSQREIKDANSNGSNLYIGTSGKVGIGTTDTTRDLNIAGNGQLGLLSSNPGLILTDTNNSNKTWDISADNSNLSINETGVNAAITFEAGGNVGIGSASPAFKLDVDGGVISQGLGMRKISSWCGTSEYGTIFTSNGTGGLNDKEVYVTDGYANATQISAHNPETGEYFFFSKNLKTGRKIQIEMERLVRKVEEITGEKFIFESQEDPLEG